MLCIILYYFYKKTHSPLTERTNEQTRRLLFMNIDKIVRRSESHYASHGAALKLNLREVIGSEDRLIFDVKIKKGTKESLVFDRASDIRSALGLQLFQPFKEGFSILLAVSERPVTENSLQKMLASPAFQRSEMRLPLALGYDMRGAMHFADLIKFPHAMYGGATNSGKTIGLQSLILSIAFKQPVNRANLIVIDTGANDLNIFKALPHLSCPIVKDEETAVRVMQSLTDEMERRVMLPIEELRLLPAIICVVDEYISLINNISSKEKMTLTATLSSLLRRGRHAKIHILLATQEPSKESMQINLNNVNARMALTCSNLYNSLSLLGESGAEKLPGKGAMMFKSPEHPKPICLQGAFISTKDIEQLIARITSVPHDFRNKFVIEESESLQLPIVETVLDQRSLKNDKELSDIIMWALSRKNVSALQIIEQFHMGNRAYDIVDDLCNLGIVSDQFANQPRKVIPQNIEDLSSETLVFLECHGYASEYIEETFNTKDGKIS